MADRDCPFLYWDNTLGWLGGLRCRKTGDQIQTGSALYENYCHNWESSYKQCANFVPAKESGGCYLTSACVEAMGMADDCRELTVLRRFRDEWLAKQPEGKQEIDEYYKTAPAIVAKIHAQEDCGVLLKKLYEQLVLPCVRYIEGGKYESAYTLYKKVTRKLQKEYMEGKLWDGSY